MKLKELRPLGIAMTISYIGCLLIFVFKTNAMPTSIDAGMLLIYVLVAVSLIHLFLSWLLNQRDKYEK